MSESNTKPDFKSLALSAPIMKALDRLGYEEPSPIQAEIIPYLMDGKDVIGQAQTGTGKTAAFALPLLSTLDLSQKSPQVLVLAPTRELAIQVAEAFQGYASEMRGFHVLPIYGGQPYTHQLQQLRRGVHVIVGTPGRVMDHMRRGSLKLDELRCLVLDEADEMLRMGFIDDVEWVLEQTPDERQVALFSATMPKVIRTIARKHLNNPKEVSIQTKTTTADTIRQRVLQVRPGNKLDALTRILESEEMDAMIIFVRTKTATVELAEKLEARGYSTAALNGDIVQKQRERTVDNLKNGKLDIVVATDVAARGLDVKRISHVVNYDIPHDTESYVHRIGRTGRAGRSGEAILFASSREQRLLNAIERATRKKIEPLILPSASDINDKRISRFQQRITVTLENSDLSLYRRIIQEYQQQNPDLAIEDIAIALASMAQGDAPLLLKSPSVSKGRKDREERAPRERSAKPSRRERESGSRREGGNERSERSSGNDDKPSFADEPVKRAKKDKKKNTEGKSKPERNKKQKGEELPMHRYRLEVGSEHGAAVGNIVGAIANEAGLDSQYIGRVDVHEEYSVVDLPQGMPRDIFNELKKARVAGRKLDLSIMDSE